MEDKTKIRLTRAEIVKDSGDKYPYWAQIIHHNITEEQKADWEYIVSILYSRQINETLVVNDEADWDISCMYEEGVRYINRELLHHCPAELFENTAPTLDEVYFWIEKILGIKDESSARQLLFSMRQQHIYPDFVNSLFGPDD